MHLAHVDSTEVESSTPPRSRGNKALVAGVTVATAGALAIAPVIVAPTPTDIRVAASAADRTDAYGLAAFDSAFSPYAALLENLYGEIVTGRDVHVRVPDDDAESGYRWEEQFQASLISNISNALNGLVQALSKREVHEGFLNAVQNIDLLNALGNLPEYAEAFTSSGDLGGDFLEHAITTLLIGEDGEPGALQRTFDFLSKGEFFNAFSEINYWFLVEGLSAGRQSQIDGGLLFLPGDILHDLGLVPLANIIGHSSLKDYEVDGKALSNNDGLLGRSMIGNLGRALLAPPITAIFQTMEILDDVQGFIAKEQYDLAVAELIAAPAKITGAFLVGYVPGPLMDFSMEAGRGQAFPGIFSPTGPLDFVFNQIPNEIRKGLLAQKPVADEEEQEKEETGAAGSQAGAKAAEGSPSDASVNRKAITVSLNGDATKPEAPVTEEETGTENTDVVEEVEEKATEEESTGGLITSTDDAKGASSTRDRLTQFRDQATERRQARIENTQSTINEVRSNIRQGLGLDRSKKAGSEKSSSGSSTGSSSSESGGSDE